MKREYTTKTGTVYIESEVTNGEGKLTGVSYERVNGAGIVNIRSFAYVGRESILDLAKKLKTGIGPEEVMGIAKKLEYKGKDGCIVFLDTDKEVKKSSLVTKIMPSFE